MVVLLIGAAVVDVIFNHSRLIDGLWGRSIQLGYSLNYETSKLTALISPFHGASRFIE